MKKIIILLLLIMSAGFCRGQNRSKIDLVAGLGLPELFHLGVKVQVGMKHLIGFSYGNSLSPSENSSYNSFTLDHQYHFGKVSILSQRRVWFFRQGLSYTIDNTRYSETDDLILDLSIGREFNFTPRFGISSDIGLFKALSETETVKDPSFRPWINLSLVDFPVLPLLRVQLFYRL